MRLVAALLAVAFSLAAFGKDVPSRDLPQEARQTLELIKSNGPFPYTQDGATFGNREKRLPLRANGLLPRVHGEDARREGSRRTAHRRRQRRRVLLHGDHYRSFRRIRD